MGEVNLPGDGKLDREAAIKMLPEAMARDRQRVARFAHEAKVLASFNLLNMIANGKRYWFASTVDSMTTNVRRGPTIPLNRANALDAIVPTE